MTALPRMAELSFFTSIGHSIIKKLWLTCKVWGAKQKVE